MKQPFEESEPESSKAERPDSNHQIWFEEAARRVKAYEEGRISALPGEKVMADMRARVFW